MNYMTVNLTALKLTSLMKGPSFKIFSLKRMAHKFLKLPTQKLY